jgi:hypothetical protein
MRKVGAAAPLANLAFLGMLATYFAGRISPVQATVVALETATNVNVWIRGRVQDAPLVLHNSTESHVNKAAQRM